MKFPRKDSFEQTSPHLESGNKELKTFIRVDDLSNMKHGEFGKQEQITPADEGVYDANDDKSYSPFLVQADVHPVGPASEILKLSSEKLKSLQQTDPSMNSVKPSTRKVAFQDEADNEEPKSVDEALEMFEEISRKYELGSRLEAIRESLGEDSIERPQCCKWRSILPVYLRQQWDLRHQLQTSCLLWHQWLRSGTTAWQWRPSFWL